jgi:hypothetical protein
MKAKIFVCLSSLLEIFLAYSSTLKMERVCFSETSKNFYRNMQRYESNL